MIALLVGLAAADVPDACATEPRPPPGAALSVAWVSPLRRRAGNNRFLIVAPSAELRWAVAEEPGSVARMLQLVGLRRSDREPRRRYKVVVFDARTDDLASCGRATDRRSDTASLALFGATWSALAADGFCVLPAERFVTGGPR